LGQKSLPNLTLPFCQIVVQSFFKVFVTKIGNRSFVQSCVRCSLNAGLPMATIFWVKNCPTLGNILGINCLPNLVSLPARQMPRRSIVFKDFFYKNWRSVGCRSIVLQQKKIG
jgi:hypothetical protein